jgi:hypothetical protein
MPPAFDVDRSLGEDAVKFMGPPVQAPGFSGVPDLAGLGQPHEPGWHNPAPDVVAGTKLTGLDNALSHVTNPTAVAAITAAKARKASSGGV